MQWPVLMAQRHRAKRDALYGALGIPAFDVVANAKDVLDQIAGAAEKIADQGLRTETDRDADDAGAG